MPRKSLGVLLTLAVAIACHAARAQSAPDASQPSAAGQEPGNQPAMPSDPKQLLELAARLNGLEGPDVKPWHLKATYETFDEKGKSTGTGTYEEWWAAPNKYKRSYTSSSFTQTDYATGTGLFRSGEQKWPGVHEMPVRMSLLEPFPDPAILVEFKVSKREVSSGNIRLSCVTLTYPLRENLTVGPHFFPSYCFDSKAPVLRFADLDGGSLEITYNGIARFQNRYIARNIVVLKAGKQSLKVNLDLLEVLASPADALLLPAADASPVAPALIPLSSDIMQSLRIKSAVPIYPEAAKQARIQGTVNLHATIGKDGRITALHATGGPSMLVPPAIDAVHQWIYRPFLFSGAPVEVETDIHVVFSLGN